MTLPEVGPADSHPLTVNFAGELCRTRWQFYTWRNPELASGVGHRTAPSYGGGA